MLVVNKIEVMDLKIPDVKLIKPRFFPDHRGYFVESYNKESLRECGIDYDFIQDNQSLSIPKSTVRGLHFQTKPFELVKLIRVLKGSIFDVAVDIRLDSPGFGKHVSIQLNAEDGYQVLIPIGFAHGFCTLEPNTEVLYKVTNYYVPSHDKGILWNDPQLGIEWPIMEDQAILSDKDKLQPRLHEMQQIF